MRTPQMLPWLARKAGVSDAQAEKFWVEATRYAAEQTGPAETPEFWKAAVARLTELIDAEKQALHRIEAERASLRGRWPYTLILQMKSVSHSELGKSARAESAASPHSGH